MEGENRFILRVKDADGNWIEIPGIQGKAAGFGETSAEISMLPAGSDPTVSVETSGPDTAKEFSFAFGIPEVDTTDVEAATAAANAAASSAAATEAAVEAAEALRVSAESARVSAESARVSAESARVSAETARASAETSRQSAETARETAETARASAESARETAEDARETAETARENAETERAAEFAGWEETINSKADQTALTAEIERATAAEATKAAAADLTAEITRATAAEATKADKTALAKTDKRVELLTKLTQGQTWDIETDTTAAYSKTVPAGAVAVGVNSIGGHSEVVDGELLSAGTEKIVSKGTDESVIGTITIPDELRNFLETYGYGKGTPHKASEMDLSGMVFHQRCRSYTFSGNETFNYNENGFFQGMRGTTVANRMSHVLSVANIVSDKFVFGGNGSASTLPDMSIRNYYENYYPIQIKMASVGSNVTAFKAAIAGSKLTYSVLDSYELHFYDPQSPLLAANGGTITPDYTMITADDSPPSDARYIVLWAHLFPDDLLMDAEAGGSITFEQTGDTEFTVPNSTDFYVKIEEALTE